MTRVRLAFIIAALFVVITLLVTVSGSPVPRMDRSLLIGAHHDMLDHHWLLSAARAVTHLGDPLTINLLVLAAAIVAARLDSWRLAAAVLVARLIEVLVKAGISALVDRPRPEPGYRLTEASGASYPSGHTAGFAVVAATAVLILPRRCRIVVAVMALALTAAVGASRVLLGVHYPSDVFGGGLLGLLVAGLSVSGCREPDR